MHDPRLIRDLKSRYGVGSEFAAAYLDFWLQPGGRHAGQAFTSLDDILKIPPPDSTWFDYAMSTNQRGRDLCALILRLPQLSGPPRRYLDVGCGFGGLLAAFAERGSEVRGIELDADRVKLARANCRDHGWTGVDEVVVGDVLDEALVARLGQFDVITMVDVIEHVLDVPLALAHVARLLNRGGLALLEIPNRHSLRFVARDGHFSLFGITLLDRDDAMAYHRTAFSFPYDVGDYHELDEYRRLFERLGCEFHLADPVTGGATPDDVPALLASIQTEFDRYMKDVRPGLPPSLDATLQVNLAEYVATVAADYRRVIADASTRAGFSSRYLSDFWRVVAVKTTSGVVSPG